MRFSEATPLRRFHDRAPTQAEGGVKGGPQGHPEGTRREAERPLRRFQTVAANRRITQVLHSRRWDPLCELGESKVVVQSPVAVPGEGDIMCSSIRIFAPTRRKTWNMCVRQSPLGMREPIQVAFFRWEKPPVVACWALCEFDWHRPHFGSWQPSLASPLHTSPPSVNQRARRERVNRPIFLA
jgi:hypothetical protein